MALDFILLISICIQLYLAPFTKVEESFNMQAMHDLTVYGTENIQYFDHIMFPGVVPRTFISSIIVSIITIPLKYITNIVLLSDIGTFSSINININDNDTGVGSNNMILLYICRFVIGLLSWLSFCYLRNAASYMLYKDINNTTNTNDTSKTNATSNNTNTKQKRELFCTLYNILISFSFHLPFYMSRSLPNTFALIGVMIAMGLWMQVGVCDCVYIYLEFDVLSLFLLLIYTIHTIHTIYTIHHISYVHYVYYILCAIYTIYILYAL